MMYTNTPYDDLLQTAEEQLDRWREIRKSLRIMKKQEQTEDYQDTLESITL